VLGEAVDRALVQRALAHAVAERVAHCPGRVQVRFCRLAIVTQGRRPAFHQVRERRQIAVRLVMGRERMHRFDVTVVALDACDQIERVLVERRLVLTMTRRFSSVQCGPRSLPELAMHP
jgi:hypothetical protein